LPLRDISFFKNVSSLELQSVDASDSQWSKISDLAVKFGPTVHHLSLNFDGLTNYTTEFSGIKETLNKFVNLQELTLNVFSG
jgi:hypothetical protein